MGRYRAKLQWRSLHLLSNVTIERNRCIRQTDPNLKFPTYLQGIDAFDSDWTNLTVSTTWS